MSLAEHPHAVAAPADGEPADLRAPLVAAALIAVGVAALSRPGAAIVALAAALALAAAMRVRPRDALGRLAHVEGFLLGLIVFLPFTTPGRTILSLGPLQASTEGLALGLLIALKVNAVALTLMALLGRAAPERLGSALMSLGAPERFVRLMELLLRHSHTARDSLRRQSEAMRARGFRMRSNLHSWRSFGHLFGGALLRAFDRAERVEEAMRMRGAVGLAHAPLGSMPATGRAACALAAGVAVLVVLIDRLA